MISLCPACDIPLENGIIALDHSVSGESFQLLNCPGCHLMKTDFPEGKNITSYYISQDYISHTGTAGNLIQKIYLLVRNHTLNRKLKLLNSLKSPVKSVADIGCGTGHFLKKMYDSGWEISGVEPSDIARASAERTTGTTIGKDIRTLASSFGVITLWHVLEHLPDPLENLKKLAANLHPGGTLLIAVPNPNSWDSYHYGKFWAALDVPRHLWHFSQPSIRRLAEKSGLRVTHTLPMYFDSYYVSMLSESYKTGRKRPIIDFLYGIWYGFHSNLGAKKSTEFSSLIYLLKK